MTDPAFFVVVVRARVPHLVLVELLPLGQPPGVPDVLEDSEESRAFCNRRGPRARLNKAAREAQNVLPHHRGCDDESDCSRHTS